MVHGGLGTTVEALRMRKPTAVTGILLMDQRFWGLVCYEKGVGPKPMHIEARSRRARLARACGPCARSDPRAPICRA